MKFVIPLKDLVLDPEHAVDAGALPEAELFSRMRNAYGFLAVGMEFEVVGDSVEIRFEVEDEGVVRQAETQFKEAVSLSNQGKLSKAVPLYERLVELAPWHAPAKRNLAMALVESGRIEEAKDLLVEVILLLPEDSQAFSILGKYYAQQADRLDLAERYLGKAYELNPEDAYTLINLATLKIETGAEAEAAELYRKVLELDPSLPNPYYGLATLECESDPTAARGYLDRMFAVARFEDRRMQTLATESRELYLKLCAQEGSAETQELWTAVKKRHMLLSMQTGLKISLQPSSAIGSTSAELKWVNSNEVVVLYNPTAELLGPAMVGRELERVGLRHEFPGVMSGLRLKPLGSPLENSLLAHCLSIPETRMADLRFLSGFEFPPPGAVVDLHLRTDEEGRALERIRGMKGFSKSLIKLYRFCAAFSAFSADRLLDGRSQYGAAYSRLPCTPLVRELAEELAGPDCVFPDFLGRYVEASGLGEFVL